MDMEPEIIQRARIRVNQPLDATLCLLLEYWLLPTIADPRVAYYLWQYTKNTDQN